MLRDLLTQKCSQNVLVSDFRYPRYPMWLKLAKNGNFRFFRKVFSDSTCSGVSKISYGVFCEHFWVNKSLSMMWLYSSSIADVRLRLPISSKNFHLASILVSNVDSLCSCIWFMFMHNWIKKRNIPASSLLCSSCSCCSIRRNEIKAFNWILSKHWVNFKPRQFPSERYTT
jgi:hypothetical protein